MFALGKHSDEKYPKRSYEMSTTCFATWAEFPNQSANDTGHPFCGS